MRIQPSPATSLALVLSVALGATGCATNRFSATKTTRESQALAESQHSVEPRVDNPRTPARSSQGRWFGWGRPRPSSRSTPAPALAPLEIGRADGAPIRRVSDSADEGDAPIILRANNRNHLGEENIVAVDPPANMPLGEALFAEDSVGPALGTPPEASCANGRCSVRGGRAGITGKMGGLFGVGCSGKSCKKNPNRRDIGSNNPCFPRELRMVSHPLYVVEPPDILYIEFTSESTDEARPIAGERLVRQDGTISLGYYGQMHVAGLTITEIEDKLRKWMLKYNNKADVFVDVASFNSKVYYVLGQVQQSGRLPITGNETVLDALTLAGGPNNFAKIKDIHVARPNPGGGCDQILHVDYRAIVECGDTRTNYQLLPGDRVVVPGTKGFQLSVIGENFLTPFERLFNLFAIFRFATR